jgi:hypothetical protein
MTSCALDDFNSGESFDVTTNTFAEYVTWDSTNLYLGYQAGDLGTASDSKWILVYIDTDPGLGDGASNGMMFTGQASAFPVGFRPDHLLAWKLDNLTVLKMVYSGGWTSESYTSGSCKGSNTLKLSIPLSALGSPTQVGLTTFFISETSNPGWTYGGLLHGSFDDGDNPSIGKYLLADFASTLSPNDASNQKP